MNLRDQIMNLCRTVYPHNLPRDDILAAYRMGYRDARRDAAELAASVEKQEQTEKGEQ